MRYGHGDKIINWSAFLKKKRLMPDDILLYILIAIKKIKMKLYTIDSLSYAVILPDIFSKQTLYYAGQFIFIGNKRNTI